MPSAARMSVEEARALRSSDPLERPLLFTWAGQADSRRAYTSRRVLLDALASLETHPQLRGRARVAVTNSSSSSWDTGYASSLGKTLFGLAPRGDTPTSNRIYDVLNVGCIPVIVSDAWLSEAAPGLGIPWARLLLQIKEPAVDGAGTVSKREIDRIRLALSALANTAQYAPERLRGGLRGKVGQLSLITEID